MFLGHANHYFETWKERKAASSVHSSRQAVVRLPRFMYGPGEVRRLSVLRADQVRQSADHPYLPLPNVRRSGQVLETSLPLYRQPCALEQCVHLGKNDDEVG